MSIRIFDLQYDDEFRKKFHEGVDDILNTAFLSNHKYVEKFEDSFSKLHQTFSTGVNSGTSALEAAFRAISVKNKVVIMPTNTFIATAVAIEQAGGTPYLVDIENNYFGICPQRLEQAISSIGKEKIACVCAVHIGSHVSPHFKKIVEICSHYNLPLVEDSAHTPGAKLEGKLSGTIGEIGCYSFFLTKVLSSAEGGMIVTKNRSLDKEFKSIRRFGMDLNNSIMHTRDGRNMKMTEFQGLLGWLETERFWERIDRRRELANVYQKNLNPDLYRCISDNSETQGSYYKQIVIPLRKTREEIEEKLRQKEIPLTGGVYYIPVHKQGYYKNKYLDQSFPISDNFSSTHFCPPCYPELRESDILKVVEVLNGIT